MARVLFFLQLIAAVVVLPFWPGLEPRYAFLGLVFLALVITLPWATVVGVYGPSVAWRAVGAAWSTQRLPSGSQATAAWTLAVRAFPGAGVAAGLTALVGGLLQLDSQTPFEAQVLALAFFGLVWGFLGLLLGRILQQVVVRLSQGERLPLLVLDSALAKRFGLTPRELEAAQAVLDGLTYKDAALRLAVSPATVKSHVLSVYQKTGAGNKIELLRLVEAETGRVHQKVDGAGVALARS